MPPVPRVLIVCDDTIIANLAASMLQKSGFGILGIHRTGQEALYLTAKLAPDLVVMDTTIGGTMDAIDAGHAIFQLFYLPVVFLAGIQDEAKLARIKYAQPYGVVFRPFTQSQIATIAELAVYVHADRLPTLGKVPVGESQRMLDLNDEAIIILDKRGRILLFNTYASWMVDLPLEKAFMRPWRDAMMFVSDTSGEEVSDPVTEATRNMAGSIYDASISLVTTTSKRRKVILKVRPIEDNHRRLIAAMMSVKENRKTYM